MTNDYFDPKSLRVRGENERETERANENTETVIDQMIVTET